MSGWLLLASVFWPLLLVGVMGLRLTRRLALRAAPWAALPALIAALLLPADVSVELPWVFIGSSFALDPLARAFLIFSAALWLAAGIYASGYLKANHDQRSTSFFVWFLATMGGNLALIPAQDMVTYVVFFALMGFSAYGLVIHDPKAQNLRAGRIYISMTVLGEMSAFVGLLWAAYLAGGQAGFAVSMPTLQASPHRDVILQLLFVGFGIKLGIMPLHVWLPLAHPAAPTPASAVLSGVMIKTGLLLWLRVFPFGVGASDWGCVLVGVGLFTAFAGALIGMTQTHPKALLAYSSVSQMGLAAIGVGVGLAAAGKSTAVMTSVALFAAHHAFAKGALFLGVGLAACETSAWNRRLLAAGLGICGAALAGFPLTSGMAAKGALKYLVAGVGMPWSSLLEWLLPLTGITTMLLMIRFLFIAVPPPREPHGAWNPTMFVPWVVLVLGVLVLPWLALGMGWIGAKQAGLYPAGAWKAAWPPLAAAVIAVVVWNAPRVMAVLSHIRIPPGDVLSAFLHLLYVGRTSFVFLVERPSRMIQGMPSTLLAQWTQHHGNLLQRMARYENFALGMLLMTALALGMAWMLWP